MHKLQNPQRGSTLVELMIALVILSVGLAALTGLFGLCMASNHRNGKDSSATMLAKMVVEQIASQHTNSNATIIITDCAGTNWTVATAPGAAPNGNGAALDQNSSSPTYGLIDQTQAYSAIPANYAMKYADCGNPNTGKQMQYDIRWNVIVVTPNVTRMITASARQAGLTSGQLNSKLFAQPVTIRTITGP